MRTVELSDEVFERAAREATELGVPVDQLVERLVDKGVPARSEGTGYRAKFPIFESKVPGTLNITKDMIDQVELEDDLRRSGLLGYE